MLTGVAQDGPLRFPTPLYVQYLYIYSILPAHALCIIHHLQPSQRRETALVLLLRRFWARVTLCYCLER
jgi:hypothetical protein